MVGAFALQASFADYAGLGLLSKNESLIDLSLPPLQKMAMEPFSVVASAVNITDFALSGIKHLHSLMNDVEEAADVVQDIRRGLDGILQSLQAVQQMMTSNSEVSAAAQRALNDAGVAKAVNECGEACNEFAKISAKWNEHSRPEPTVLRDRAVDDIWYKERIKTMRVQVQSCQSRVELAVQIANLKVIHKT